jgi:hypothetical protein
LRGGIHEVVKASLEGLSVGNILLVQWGTVREDYSEGGDAWKLIEDISFD